LAAVLKREMRREKMALLLVCFHAAIAVFLLPHGVSAGDDPVRSSESFSVEKIHVLRSEVSLQFLGNTVFT
jgi:hypothetical protein